jgi:inositol phosphorylceramide mannosyltransferase catalytic subunit
MKVPKIIHQIWNDNVVPNQFAYFTETWKANHPEWKYLFWTHSMIREFIRINFPLFLKTYDKYPTKIQRAEAARYLLLYKYGGLYVDLDFECLQNVEQLLNNHNCVIGIEPEAHCIEHNVDMIVCNAFMASIPNCPFLLEIIEKLSYTPIKIKPSLTDLLKSTGPFMLTHLYHTYPIKDEIKLLKSEMVYPLSKAECIHFYNENNLEKKDLLRSNGCFAIHYFWGLWWREKSPFKIHL